jgi:Flp pilus assembly protein TadG
MFSHFVFRGMPRSRRGTYTSLYLALIIFGIAIGGGAIDNHRVNLANGRAQDVADAAAHAALIALRNSGGDTVEAASLASAVAAANTIGGIPAEISSIQFGVWDEVTAELIAVEDSPTAVLVEVSTPAEQPFVAVFTGLTHDISGQATAATQTVQLLLVMDITGSFRNDIHHARDGAVAFLDVMEGGYSGFDQIGMVTFFQRFGHVWTPLTDVAGGAVNAYGDDIAAVRTKWDDLTWCDSDHDWIVDDYDSWFGWDPDENDGWHNVDPGHANMPDCFGDEGGTDHGVGLTAAIDHLNANADPMAFQAIVMLTDGLANNVPYPDPGRRPVDHTEAFTIFEEGTWPDATKPQASVISGALSEADRAWANGIHVWSVSYGENNSLMQNLPRGLGGFYETNDPSELEPIFEEIARSMPVLLVE